MTGLELLKRLDQLRTRVRSLESFKKSPRGIIPSETSQWLMDLAEEVVKADGPRSVSIELDENGRPIITADLKDLFATAPEEPPAPQAGARVQRRNATPASGPEASVLPREDHVKHKNHPPVLMDATEDTVER